jgi:tetratricopeptide (TPR) repeat protein
LSIDGSQRRVALLLVLLVAVLYQGTLRSGFHYDDFHAVVRNPHLSLSNTVNFFHDPSMFSVNPESAMYRPWLLTTFSLNRAVSGDRPWSYHLGNVMLHAANTVAVLWLLRLLGLSAGACALASVLFAVHPLNSEAVSYVSSRSQLLATLGVLLFCSLTLRASTTTHRLTGVVCLIMALMSKSVAIVSPALALLGWQRTQDHSPSGDHSSSGEGQSVANRTRILWASVVAVVLVVYLTLIRSLLAKAVFDAPVRDRFAQVATQAKALGYYLWLTVMPVRLSVEHQFDVSRALDPIVGLAALFVGSLAIVCYKGRGTWRWGSLWWLICLLPTTVVPLIVLVNEHRLYGAGIGALVLIAVVLSSLHLKCRPVAAGLIAAYTIMLALLTVQRVDVWRSESSLWQDAAQKAPASLKAQLRWADVLDSEGEFELAEQAYLRALALRPFHAAARNNLGRSYLVRGRLDEASLQFQALLERSPDNVPARMNLGQTYFRQGQMSEARNQYEAALGFDLTQGRAQLRIAQIGLHENGSTAEILDWLDRAWEAGERSVDVFVSRAIALRRAGQLAEALSAYQSAIAINADSPDVWYNLGNLYVEQGNETAAAQAYVEAIRNAEEGSVIRRSAQDRLRALKVRQTSP